MFGSINFRFVSSRSINFDSCIFVHDLLKWFTAGPRMHARTLTFYVGGAMPALAAVARLPGMHVCFPRMYDRVSAFRLIAAS